MPKPLTIAQLTDVHLGPIRGFTPRHWSLKRLTGYLNWQKNRRNAYQRVVLDRLVADLRQQAPDHIVVTGDLANIGLPRELMGGLDWLRSLGEPQAVSVIPGNHDIYGHLRPRSRHRSLGRLMASCAEGALLTGGHAGFPYVRRLGQVALIGVNSAVVTPPMMAWGEVGAAQRERLGRLLDQLGQAQLFRLVLIHHPPLPGQAKPARALRDAPELEKVLTQHGAELVIHGHNHLNSLAWRQSASGPLPVVGAPSASLARRHKHEPLARYNLYRIEGPPWRIELIGRGLSEPGGQVRELERHGYWS